MSFEWFSRGNTPAPRADQGMIAELRAYWEALRHQGALPHRGQIDPRGIANALENSLLIERVCPGIARVRIAGTAFNDLMGMDIRGMPLSCLFMGEARPVLQDQLEDLFRKPSALSLQLSASRGIGRPELKARLQLLPLTDENGISNLAIGCLEMTGQLGQSPRRFHIESNYQEKLALPPVAVEAPLPAREAIYEMLQANVPLNRGPHLTVVAANAAYSQSRKQSLRAAGHLRLVKG